VDRWHSDIVAKVRDVAPDVTWTHCFIHRETLAAKGMSSKFKTVLEDSIKIINFIKARPLNSRYFHYLAKTWVASTNSFFFILKFAGFHGVRYSQGSLIQCHYLSHNATQ
jgi:hypothetical protein